MRGGLSLIIAGMCAALASPAHAQTGPVIVVPGKPGMPVILNGVIVDGAVVYGEWGLAKPNNSGLIIQGAVGYAPSAASWSPGYFPATGVAPRVGRVEIEPPARPRAPANTNYYRNWSIESEFTKPVTEYPPFEPPPVIVAPRERRSGPVTRDRRAKGGEKFGG